jgi:hypothetical protein
VVEGVTVMGIELYWDNDEQTVMLCEVDGPWTWDELYDTVLKIKKVTDRTDHEVGAILDVSRGLFMSPGAIFSASGWENMKRILALGDDKGTGPLVIVGANSVIRRMYDTIKNFDPHKFRNVQFADTADQARALLAQRMMQPA